MIPHVDDGQLNAFLDGEVTAEERRALEAHLEGCAPCRARLAEAQHFLDEAGSLISLLEPVAQASASPAAPASVPQVETPAEPPPAAPLEAPRPSSRTAREVAIDIDGATHKSPAIRLFGQQAERHGVTADLQQDAPRVPDAPGVQAHRRAGVRWFRYDAQQLAWAASIVLTFGIGYLASELRRAGTQAAPAGEELSRLAAAASDTATAPAARPAERVRIGTSAGARGVESRTQGPREPVAIKPAAARRPKPVATLAEAPGPAADAQPLDVARPQPTLAPAAPPAPTGELRMASPSPAAGMAGAAGAPSANLVAPRRMADRALDAADERAALTRFGRSTADTAIARMSGSIRLIDGMNYDHVELGPGRLVAGAAPNLDVVRVVYADARGRRIVLDQQRLPPGTDADAAAGRGVGLLYGDTLVTTSAATTRIRWLDRKNFWMSLTAPLPADSVRALVERVR